MKRPKSIDVFGKEYKIVYKKLAEDLHGECKNSSATIEIDAQQTGVTLTHTLLHEYFHALMYRTGITQAIPSELEEVICETFATFLTENKLVK